LSSRLVPRDAKQKSSNHSRTLDLADGDGARTSPLSARCVGGNEEGLYGAGGSGRHVCNRPLGVSHSVSTSLLCTVSGGDTPNHSVDDNCRAKLGQIYPPPGGFYKSDNPSTPSTLNPRTKATKDDRIWLPLPLASTFQSCGLKNHAQSTQRSANLSAVCGVKRPNFFPNKLLLLPVKTA